MDSKDKQGEKVRFEEETKSKREAEREELNAGKRAGLEWVKGASYKEIMKYRSTRDEAKDQQIIYEVLNTYGRQYSEAWAIGWLHEVWKILDEVESKNGTDKGHKVGQHSLGARQPGAGKVFPLRPAREKHSG